MSTYTQQQQKAAEQERETGQERGGKKDRISLIAVILSLHNFSMFSSGGKKLEVLERKEGSKYMTQEKEIQAK